MTDSSRKRWCAVLVLSAVWGLSSTAALAASTTGIELQPPAAQPATRNAEQAQADAPSSLGGLFGDDIPAGKQKEKAGSGFGVRGFVQTEVARTIASPTHWSKLLTRAELGAQGAFNDQVKWKLSGRLDYDAVYDLTNFYPSDVKKDQRFNLYARENYLDFGAGNWDFRFGRQQIVWGEVVGLFFADVVSAKDRREFILPDFDILRIPQWAARAEYSGKDVHAELLWVPVASYDNIGKPGAEFFPAPPPPPPGFATQFQGEVRPARDLANSNYGVRLSTLQSGWDVSGFYYRSTDASPTFYRQVVTVPQPAFIFQPRHSRITQFGSTVAKDFRSFVLKGEAVYTRGRQFEVMRLSDVDGVVQQNTLDWVLGLDFTLPKDTRLNVQLFQRLFFNHDPDIVPKKHENGYSVLLNHKLTDSLEGQLLWISSLNRSDWMLRPRVTWNFEKNWRVAAGVDVFHGPPLGFFGRFNNRDRVYSELRYSF
jgi:hypothetical protein